MIALQLAEPALCLLCAWCSIRVLAPRASNALTALLAALFACGLWSSLYVAARLSNASFAVELSTAAALAVCCAIAARRWPATRARPERALARVHPGLRAAALLVAAISAAAIAEHAARFPEGSWDAWMIWNSRARFLFRASGDVSAMFSAELGQTQFRTHADYPLLLPGLVAALWRATGGESLALSCCLSVSFAILCASLLVTAVRSAYGARAGWLAGLALATTPIFVTLAPAQCADVPLATFLLAACACLSFSTRGPDGERWRWLALAGVFAALGALTKNEGIPMLAGVLIAGASGAGDGRAKSKRAAAVMAGAAPFVWLLLCFKALHAPANDLIGAAGELAARATSAGRWALIAGAFARRLVYFQDWALHLSAGVALALLLWRARETRRPCVAALLPLAVALAADLLALAITPHDLRWHLKTVDRLLFQLWPAALFSLAAIGGAHGRRGEAR